MPLTYIYYVRLILTLFLFLILQYCFVIFYLGVDIMNYLPINETILNTHKSDC